MNVADDDDDELCLDCYKLADSISNKQDLCSKSEVHQINLKITFFFLFGTLGKHRTTEPF